MTYKTRVTVESLTAELDDVRDGALAAEQYGAAKAAIETKAKLHGYLVDRQEIGKPGDFQALGTRDELVAKARADHGDAFADAVAAGLAALDAKAEDEAKPQLALPHPDSFPSPSHAMAEQGDDKR